MNEKLTLLRELVDLMFLVARNNYMIEWREVNEAQTVRERFHADAAKLEHQLDQMIEVYQNRLKLFKIGDRVRFINEPDRWGVVSSYSDDGMTLYYHPRGSGYASATVSQMELDHVADSLVGFVFLIPMNLGHTIEQQNDVIEAIAQVDGVKRVTEATGGRLLYQVEVYANSDPGSIEALLIEARDSILIAEDAKRCCCCNTWTHHQPFQDDYMCKVCGELIWGEL